MVNRSIILSLSSSENKNSIVQTQSLCENLSHGWTKTILCQSYYVQNLCTISRLSACEDLGRDQCRVAESTEMLFKESKWEEGLDGKDGGCL